MFYSFGDFFFPLLNLIPVDEQSSMDTRVRAIFLNMIKPLVNLFKKRVLCYMS